ncbi:hypothetical protein NXW95_00445 [Phocaeicola vulgatus]|nr:hypothetical protein [Phocaeicola vulgatus]MCS2665462.1 hypothetical protein [Phocaeicola vulgatus]MCS3011518.1 hypothetical protein [Phocaeicola vulgatus]MCS3015791.1 hypothetical protein [Phocaeicola vulgatus]
MKRIEFVLCLFFISTVSFAQKEIAPTKNLDAYIGTWMYQSNDTIFKIVLKKGYAEDQHMIINGLMGGYFLSVKGIIVENYFSIRDTIWHLDKKRELKIFLSGLQTMLPVWTTLILIESEFYFTTNGRSTSAEKGY